MTNETLLANARSRTSGLRTAEAGRKGPWTSFTGPEGVQKGRRQGDQKFNSVRGSMHGEDQKPSRRKCASRKLSQLRLSGLQERILAHADSGLERGEIAQGEYELERRYRGFYTDPYMSRAGKKSHEVRYRRCQPAITKSLRRLETRGLIKLIRKGPYVKALELTDSGRKLVQEIGGIHERARESSAAAGAPVSTAGAGKSDGGSDKR